MKKNSTIKKSSAPKLSPEEKYWTTVEQEAHYQIADLLNKILPLPNLRKKENLDLEKDADYRTLLIEYENNYSDTKPASEILAEEITYEYLLLVVKSLLRNLSDLGCHQAEYFENLI